MPSLRRVRCPKCTALLSQPPYPVFECPICSTLLSAKGAPKEFRENGHFSADTASVTDNGSLTQVKENDEDQQRQRRAAADDQNLEGPDKSDNYGKLAEKSVDEQDGQHRVGRFGEGNDQDSHIESQKEADEINKSWTEDSPLRISNPEAENAGLTNGHPPGESTDRSSTELENGDAPMSAVEVPREEIADEMARENANGHSGEEQHHHPAENERESWDLQVTDCESDKNGSITSLVASSDNLVDWRENERENDDSFEHEHANDLSDDRTMDQLSLKDRNKQEEGEEGNGKEKYLMADGNEWSLQAQFFQKRECDLSFKYSFVTSETEDQLTRSKRNLSPKPISIASSTLRNDTSNMPLQARPKATASQLHAGSYSSKQSEEESSSSRFISTTHEEFESDFDFPAPQLQNMQDVNLPVLHLRRENSALNSGAVVRPHTLELRDLGTDGSVGMSLNPETGRREGKGYIDTGRQLNGKIFKVMEPEIDGQLHKLAAEPHGLYSATAKSGQSYEMVLVDGSSQQLPGTAKVDKRMESGTYAKETINTNTNMNKQKNGLVCHQVQHTPDQSNNGNDIEFNNPSLSASMFRETSSSEGKRMKDASSPFVQNGIMKIGIPKDDKSLSPNTKERNTISRNKEACASEPRSPRGKRNLPPKLRAYDSDGRLLVMSRAENKNRFAHLDGVAATEETSSQSGSAFEGFDMYDTPSNQTSHELDPRHNNLIGFPVATAGQGYAFPNHHHPVPPGPSTNAAYPYQQASLHPMIVTVPMQEQYPFAHHGYHPATTVCVLCMHHQHPQMSHAHCTVCFNQPVSMMHPSAHSDPWNYCHQGHSRTASSGASQTYYPSRTKVELNSTVSSPRRTKLFPPLPRDGAAPYIVCKACNAILEVPTYLQGNGNMIQKLRCGDCRKVSKFSVHHDSDQLQAKASVVVAKGKQPMFDGIQKDRGVDQAQSLHKRSPGSGVGVVNARNFLQDPGPSTSHARHFDPNSSSPNRGRKAVPVVDEQEEGLDFGAPRISDGDSLDQSESRTRSPENQGNFADVGTWAYADPQHKEEGTTRAPLLALLNQSSQKFNIDLYPHEPFDSDSLSASESPLYDQFTYGKHHRAMETRSHGHVSYQSLRRGPKYIAGLLRRSFRDIGKGQ